MSLASYFISHGGGPWPWMPEVQTANAPLLQSLQQIAAAQDRQQLKAILMVSAHWESPVGFSVMGNPQPSMLYDYFNFPEHTYHIHYRAPGSPELAHTVYELLSEQRLPIHIDNQRGFDHGAFVPAYCMFPEADIPMVQLSINRAYNPQEHMQLGRALAPLREQGVLIIGSGLSYHNLRLLGQAGQQPSAEFDQWLHQTLALPSVERCKALCDWSDAPSARLAHPREDHLVPLFVAVGAAEQAKATRVYHQTDAFGYITASSYRFG